ncbi:class I SAM-dependent methyltransferase [Patescibacteria group bacterium]
MKEEKLYRKYNNSRHWEEHPTVYAEAFADFLKNKNFSGLIVDIGCSSGRDVEVFSKSGFSTMGIDCSKEEIDLAETKYPKLKFELQNIENSILKDNSVGAYFMINVIHYVNKEKAVQEIYRTLKSGGYFFIHFNLDIVDKDGNNDYHHDENDIMQLVSMFNIIHRKIVKRKDRRPVMHTHRILELILQKQ